MTTKITVEVDKDDKQGPLKVALFTPGHETAAHVIKPGESKSFTLADNKQHLAVKRDTKE